MDHVFDAAKLVFCEAPEMFCGIGNLLIVND